LNSVKYEVESGLLSATFLQIVPESIANATEHATMKELHTSYGKVSKVSIHSRRFNHSRRLTRLIFYSYFLIQTFHLWQVHRGDKLPMGPPQLMMSFVQDGELDSSAIAARDETENIKTAHKRDARAKHVLYSIVKNDNELISMPIESLLDILSQTTSQSKDVTHGFSTTKELNWSLPWYLLDLVSPVSTSILTKRPNNFFDVLSFESALIVSRIVV
jgi:hypothetical protein